MTLGDTSGGQVRDDSVVPYSSHFGDVDLAGAAPLGHHER
jgi:hypothetical protein